MKERGSILLRPEREHPLRFSFWVLKDFGLLPHPDLEDEAMILPHARF